MTNEAITVWQKISEQFMHNISDSAHYQCKMMSTVVIRDDTAVLSSLQDSKHAKAYSYTYKHALL